MFKLYSVVEIYGLNLMKLPSIVYIEIEILMEYEIYI